MNYILDFSVDRLSAHPLDKRKHDFRSVQRWYRQNIEYRKICGNKR